MNKIKPLYEDLYIYYFNGPVKTASEKSFNKSYIGNWIEDGTSFLFFKEAAEKDISNLLKLQPELKLNDKFNMTYEEWCGTNITTILAGPFEIIPPWVQTRDDPEAIPIYLDPGVVFGAGTHPTTFDCLCAIEMAYKKEKAQSMIDLGTGTGVLALAAVLMGSKRALALDLNPLAAKTALNNVRLNNLSDKIFVIQALAQDYIDSPADLLVANIHYDVLIKLIQKETFLRKKMFIFSGLMPGQGKKVMEVLKNYPVEIFQVWDRNNWFTCYGKCS